MLHFPLIKGFFWVSAMLYNDIHSILMINEVL